MARAVWPRAAGGGAGGVAARSARADEWAPADGAVPGAPAPQASPPTLPENVAAERSASGGALLGGGAAPTSGPQQGAGGEPAGEAGPRAWDGAPLSEDPFVNVASPARAAASTLLQEGDPSSEFLAGESGRAPPVPGSIAGAHPRAAASRAAPVSAQLYAPQAPDVGMRARASDSVPREPRAPTPAPRLSTAPVAEAAVAYAPPATAPSHPSTRRPPPPVPFDAAARVLARALRTALLLAAALAAAVFIALLSLILVYRYVDPPASALMLVQRLGGTVIHRRWVPLERISPMLPLAVIASEDGRFCRHGGVDWGELADAIEGSRDGVARGGSTITMQLVKNLFLWPSRSYVRKALEIPLAYGVELAWSKRRILEIYLNVAEWGPGIFGAETAALYHFRKPASALTLREATLLAAALPNPRGRQASRPGPGMLRLANRLAVRMRSEAAGCLRARR
jgi:monofunctional biosynthetic peptidoglycan transglycosylase